MKIILKIIGENWNISINKIKYIREGKPHDLRMFF